MCTKNYREPPAKTGETKQPCSSSPPPTKSGEEVVSFATYKEALKRQLGVKELSEVIPGFDQQS